MSLRTAGYWRILRAMDAARQLAEGRPVEVVHVPGHGRHARPETRLVDHACRYAIIRLAASTESHIVLCADDLPDLGLRSGDDPIDQAFAKVVRDRLRDLDIGGDGRPDQGAFVDWRGAMRTVVQPRAGERRSLAPPPFWWLSRNYQTGCEPWPAG
ncbi:MAG: hypothetical protein ACRDYF_05285 [Acidimicrobiia bacterium]